MGMLSATVVAAGCLSNTDSNGVPCGLHLIGPNTTVDPTSQSVGLYDHINIGPETAVGPHVSFPGDDITVTVIHSKIGFGSNDSTSISGDGLLIQNSVAESGDKINAWGGSSFLNSTMKHFFSVDNSHSGDIDADPHLASPIKSESTIFGNSTQISEGDTFIKSNIGDGSSVGPYSQVINTTLAPDSHVGSWVKLKDMIVGRGVVIGNNADLSKGFIGDGATVPSGTTGNDFTINQTGNTVRGTLQLNP
jgi:hypothetical protein